MFDQNKKQTNKKEQKVTKLKRIRTAYDENDI